MPANLTPEFIKARNRFREARTPDGKLSALEEMLTTIPKHKGTDKMQADIKRRIAKLRDSQAQSKKRGAGHSYDHVPKEGAGQVVLIGPPNTGKSTLLSALTNAKPEVADYPFSTLTPVPGMMAFEDIQIQLIDLPPITPEYTAAWVYCLIRSADLALVVLDAADGELIPEELDEIVGLLADRHLRLSPAPADDPDAKVRILPCRIVLTKSAERGAVALPFPAVATNARDGRGLDDLRRAVFDALRLVRVYTKLPGEKPDLTEPYTLPAGSTVFDAVRTVHRDFVDRLKYVRIWGSGRFDGQQVPIDHRLEDGDIIEIHAA